MSDLIPAGRAPARGALLQPLRDPAGGSMLNRIGSFAAQPPVKKALPYFAGVAGLGALALVWAAMSPGSQRVLYSSLGDAERAEVVAALETGGISYRIDNATGALSVGEDDLYRARMLVASNGALAMPESGTDIIDSLPMGASRTLEGDRLRSALERELTLTIAEIDGVESVRVHLAQADRSVFVREDIPPSASVMVRMARGRQLSDQQVTAVANLVAGSVPGLSLEAVRIADQHGRLLSQPKSQQSDRLDLQARMEAKLRSQVEQLLAPMIGAGNFSSEIQVELNMDEITSARESYDKEGAVRRETLQESQSADARGAGVPGVLSNTPPVQTEAVEGAPAGGQPPAPQTNGESSTSRTYELGREVAVSNTTPGGLKRLSVAVAINQEAMAGAKPADLQKIEQLVTAAVGADNARGDQVAVIVRPFNAETVEQTPFWETPWFATILRNAVALLSVILVLLLAVRPVIKALTGGRKNEKAEEEQPEGEEGAGEAGGGVVLALTGNSPAAPDHEQLSAQMELARRIVREKPDDALAALRRMLGETPAEEKAA